MKVLVTGATGYVGSVLAPLLAERGHAVTTFDTQLFGNAIADVPGLRHVQGDIRDREAVQAAMSGQDACIHLAGVVTDELVDMNHEEAASVNIGGTENVGAACAAAGVRRLLYASSSSVYGRAAETGVPTEDVKPEPKTEYARQKLNGERILFSYQSGDLTVATVRQATACGPAPRMRLDTVVNVFSKQAWFDGRITVHGGTQYRSNIHVRDAAELYVTLLEATALQRGFVTNATHSNERVAEIAYQVASELLEQHGRAATVEIQDVPDARSYRLAPCPVTVLDNAGARTWSAARTLRQAAADNFRWFAAGGVSDPDDPIYRNNARMGPLMRAGA